VERVIFEKAGNRMARTRTVRVGQGVAATSGSAGCYRPSRNVKRYVSLSKRRRSSAQGKKRKKKRKRKKKKKKKKKKTYWDKDVLPSLRTELFSRHVRNNSRGRNFPSQGTETPNTSFKRKKRVIENVLQGGMMTRGDLVTEPRQLQHHW